jgi:hypothetical protein
MTFLLMWKCNQKITIIKTHILVMNRMSFNYFSHLLYNYLLMKLWCLTPLSTIFQFSVIFVCIFSFIGGGNQSIRRMDGLVWTGLTLDSFTQLTFYVYVVCCHVWSVSVPAKLPSLLIKKRWEIFRRALLRKDIKMKNFWSSPSEHKQSPTWPKWKNQMCFVYYYFLSGMGTDFHND